jgi:hypothetical protein
MCTPILCDFPHKGEVVFFVPRNKLFRLVCPCVIIPESTRIYGENTGKTYEEKLMNDRSAFNDKYYKWKHNCYQITCTESNIVVMLFYPVVLCCLLFMNKTVDARKVVITLHTQKQ